jgi:porin
MSDNACTNRVSKRRYKSSTALYIGMFLAASIGAANAEDSSGYFINLGAPLAGVGESLAKDGIYFTGNDTNELFDTTGGGLKHGTVVGGQADLSTTLDMNRLVGIPGAQIHIDFDYQYGALANLTGTYTGASLIASGIQGPGSDDDSTIRLAELSWSQTFLNDKIWILAGRTQSTWFFNLEPLLLQFESTNVVLGSPTLVFNTDGAGFPEATWGGLIRLKPVDSVDFKVGVFEDNNNAAYPNNHDLPGPDWTLKNSNGVLVPMKLTYAPAIMGLDGKYDVGGYYDSSYYTEPYFNGVAQRGRTGVYVHAQQKIWAPSPGSKRGLFLFGQASWATSGVNLIQNAFAVGAIDNGPFAARAADSFGLLATFDHFGGAEERYLDSVIAANGGTGKLHNEETALEAEYTIAAGPGISLRPFIQYTINPDQVFGGLPNPNDRSATVVGANLYIYFNAALGLPNAPLIDVRP